MSSRSSLLVLEVGSLLCEQEEAVKITNLFDVPARSGGGGGGCCQVGIGKRVGRFPVTCSSLLLAEAICILSTISLYAARDQSSAYANPNNKLTWKPALVVVTFQ